MNCLARSAIAYSDSIHEYDLRLGRVELRVYEFATAKNPTVLFVHGAGLHGRCWDAVVKRVQRPGRFVTFDLRGHGRSEKQPPYDWQTFGEDLVNLVTQLQSETLITVGHSLGGYIVAHAFRERPHLFHSLLLVDPAIMPTTTRPSENFIAGYGSIEEHPMEKRRDEWESVEEMYGYFRPKFPYSLWTEEVLMDYCRYGVQDSGRGNVRLCCPPIVEGLVYLAEIEHFSESDLRSINLPVVLMRARHQPGVREFLEMTHSFTRQDLAAYLPNAVDIHLPELTHFIPMQRPDLVARQIDRLLLQAAES